MVILFQFLYFATKVELITLGLIRRFTKFTLIFDKYQSPVPNPQYPISSTWCMSHFGVHYKIKKGTGRSLFPLWYAKKMEIYRFEN